MTLRQMEVTKNREIITLIEDVKEIIITAIKRFTIAMLNIQKRIKQVIIKLIERAKKTKADPVTVIMRAYKQNIAADNFQAKLLLWQQDKEVKRFESNFNILNHDRR